MPVKPRKPRPPARSSHSPSRGRRQALSKRRHGSEGAVAHVDRNGYRDRYLDEIAPSGIVGRQIKYSPKDGAFIPRRRRTCRRRQFAALCDEMLIGFMRFNGQGDAADQKMGLLYQGFVMPQVETLPDRDETQWELGLNGEPEDPWQPLDVLALQDVETLEVDTFVTLVEDRPRAVGELLRHYERMRRTTPAKCRWCGCAAAASSTKTRASAGSTSQCLSSSGAGRPTPSPSLTRAPPASSTSRRTCWTS